MTSLVFSLRLCIATDALPRSTALLSQIDVATALFTLSDILLQVAAAYDTGFMPEKACVLVDTLLTLPRVGNAASVRSFDERAVYKS